MLYSLRSADVFPVGASLPPKINSDHAKSFNFFFSRANQHLRFYFELNWWLQTFNNKITVFEQ